MYASTGVCVGNVGVVVVVVAWMYVCCFSFLSTCVLLMVLVGVGCCCCCCLRCRHMWCGWCWYVLSVVVAGAAVVVV